MKPLLKFYLIPWHRRLGRDKFLHLMFDMTVHGYIFIFITLASLMHLLDWIVPHLPLIPKSDVNRDQPPLFMAFHIANYFIVIALIVTIIGYFVGPDRNVPSLRPKKGIEK